MYENVYTNPDKFGLLILDELDGGFSYEFDLIVLWEHHTGRLYFASDAGCSCPSPFEEYTGIEALTELTERTYDQLWKKVTTTYLLSDGGSFLAKALDKLRKQVILPDAPAFVEFQSTVKVDDDVDDDAIFQALINEHVPAVVVQVQQLRADKEAGK